MSLLLVAEGFDAAAGPRLQRRLAKRRSPRRKPPDAALLLGLGRHAGAQRDGLFPLHARHQPPLRPAEAIAMLREEGLDTSSPAISATPQQPAPPSAHWGLEILCREPSEYSLS